MSSTLSLTRAIALLSISTAAVLPQSGAGETAPKQVVKPPISQPCIDVATFSGMAMGPDMMNQTLGSLMGGGGGNRQAEFGYTETGVAGPWMDVTLYTNRNTNLAEALQGVPAGTHLAPTLKLQTPERPKLPPPVSDDEPTQWNYEPPKGKLVMYWGCSETERP